MLPLIGLGISAAGSIAGGLMGGAGQKKQIAAMREAIQHQRERDAINDQNFAPYLKFGGEQLNKFSNWLGDETKNPMSMMDPAFDFRRDQGMKSITGNAATAGLLNSGDTLRGLTDYGQELASSEYGNAFNRWIGEGNFMRDNAAVGSNAAANIGGLANQGAANISNVTANTDFAAPDMLLADAVSGIGGMAGNAFARRFSGTGGVSPGGSNIFKSNKPFVDPGSYGNPANYPGSYFGPGR
jgi:hypothetical protein